MGSFLYYKEWALSTSDSDAVERERSHSRGGWRSSLSSSYETYYHNVIKDLPLLFHSEDEKEKEESEERTN